ncbi:MAG: hypothetical protein II825_06430 [Paludibacteraceae bacterium]|nr:hypothetical protein [Paludibacteraceae bacterium]
MAEIELGNVFFDRFWGRKTARFFSRIRCRGKEERSVPDAVGTKEKSLWEGEVERV